MGIYDYSVERPDGTTQPLSAYEGKVLLIVNTATGCGFTPQYRELEEFYRKYHDQGLEILDIPCNQFAGQTPGTDEEIHEFCTLKYHTGFPQMKKSDVNGEHQIPLYAYLKSQKGFAGTLHRKIKAAAPGHRHTAVNLQHIIVQGDFNEFLLGRAGFQADNSVSVQ